MLISLFQWTNRIVCVYSVRGDALKGSGLASWFQLISICMASCAYHSLSGENTSDLLLGFWEYDPLTQLISTSPLVSRFYLAGHGLSRAGVPNDSAHSLCCSLNQECVSRCESVSSPSAWSHRLCVQCWHSQSWPPRYLLLSTVGSQVSHLQSGLRTTPLLV